MGVSKWNDAGKIWLDDHGLLDAEQYAKLRRADEAGLDPTPIPTRVISNGEYMPPPQWQIEALWRFRIPEELRERYGYPEITEADKRKILGLNSARLYGIEGVESGNLEERFKPVPADYEQRMSTEFKTIMEFPGYVADNMARFKSSYADLALPPHHNRYGWVRTAWC